MEDRHRSKDELVAQLASLRRRVTELETALAEEKSAREAAGRVEEALQQCEARWRSLVDNATDIISIVDRAGKFLFTNRAPSGRSPAEALGTNAFRAFAAPYRGTAQRAVERVFETGTGGHFEAEGCGVSGCPDWCSAKLAPIKRNGQVVAVILTASDITERRRADQELRRNAALNKMRVSVYSMRTASDLHEVLDSLFEALRDAGLGFDECSVQVVDEARDAFATAWQAPHGRGYSGTEREMPIPLTKTPVYEAWRKGKPVYRRDLQKQDPYGERRTLSVGLREAIRSVVDVPFSHGTIAVNSRLPNAFSDADVQAVKQIARELSGAYTRAEDIRRLEQSEEKLRHYSNRLEEMVAQRTAELQETQDQLLRQEKLATVGQLAAGVSHDLRNPLTAISNAAYYLQTAIAAPSGPVRECVDIIDKEVKNAQRIVLDLLDFSRVERVEREQVSVAVVVTGALQNAAPPPKVEVTTKLSPNLPDLFVDGRKVKRALGNLLSNAYEATPKGGKIAITARPEKDDVLIRLRDTGGGIPQEHLERVFEPLSTTKPKGIGLGLSISRNLIRANRGTITVQSKEGRGTTFTVRLPTVQPQS